MPSPHHQRRKGAVGIVTVVVLGVLAILLGSLLVMGVQNAREAARRSSCKNNMKQLGLALHNYYDVHGMLPIGYGARDVSGTDPSAKDSGPAFAWGMAIAPQLECSSLFERINFDLDAMSDPNNALIQTSFPKSHQYFQCPSNPTVDWFTVHFDKQQYELTGSNYVGVFGYGSFTESPGNPIGRGVLYRNSSVDFRMITDGLSETLAIGERQSMFELESGEVVVTPSTWYAAPPGVLRTSGVPGETGILVGTGSLVLGSAGRPKSKSEPALTVVPNETPFVGGFSSAHRDGVMFCWADGSVKQIGRDIDPKVFRSMVIIDDVAGQFVDDEPAEESAPAFDSPFDVQQNDEGASGVPTTTNDE